MNMRPILIYLSQEVSEGKMFVDAAKLAKIELLVWSGLENFSEVSSGKYTHADHFDGYGGPPVIV